MSNCPVYRAASATFVAANGTGAFLSFAGSDTGTIVLHRIHIYSPTLSTPVFITVSVNKCSTMPTGGTATTLTNVPIDSLFPASNATVKAYTAAPSGEVSIGRVATNRFYSHKATPAADGINQSIELLEAQTDYDYIVLRSANEGICVYFDAAPGGTVSLSAAFEWCEE